MDRKNSKTFQECLFTMVLSKKIHQKVLNMMYFLELIKVNKAKWSRTFKCHVSRKIIIHLNTICESIEELIMLDVDILKGLDITKFY